MKRFFLISLFSLSCLLGAMAQTDIRGALSGLAGKMTGNGNSQAASALGGVVDALLGKSNIEAKDLVGTWNYVSPAVQFKSEDLLKKAGGSAAAGMVEEKLVPYYQKAGLTNLVMTFNDDGTFVMNAKRAKLSGTYAKDADGNFTFQFKAVKKINIGKMTANVTKTGNQIKLTFDASKLITLVDKVSVISGNTSLKTVSSLLNSYDGLNCGFTLKKQ